MWCITYLFVWSCIGSLMCCLRISNRYSRMRIVVCKWCTLLSSRRVKRVEGEGVTLSGQCQDDVASPLFRYNDCFHSHVVELLIVSQLWECTYSSSDNEIKSLYCRRGTSLTNFQNMQVHNFQKKTSISCTSIKHECLINCFLTSHNSAIVQIVNTS